MKSYIQILPLLATLGLAPAIGRADAYATNTTPGYVMKVTMASHIVCDSPGNYHYETYFTCEHYLQYGESMAFIDSWESQDCFHTYSVADITWIPTAISVDALNRSHTGFDGHGLAYGFQDATRGKLKLY